MTLHMTLHMTLQVELFPKNSWFCLLLGKVFVFLRAERVLTLSIKHDT